MTFPNKEEIEKQLKKLENVEGSEMLPPDASLSDKVKYNVCREIIVYMRKNNLTQRQLSELLSTGEARVSEIVHYKIKKITLDKLLDHLEKLNPSAKIEVA